MLSGSKIKNALLILAAVVIIIITIKALTGKKCNCSDDQEDGATKIDY